MGQRVVITGATGNVGRTVTEALEGRHTLTLVDQRARRDRETITVNLSDFAAVLDRLPAADTVVHLGATPDEAERQDILTNNIIATYNVFEVARRKGVRRIVFAKTVMNYDGFVGRAEGEILTPEHHTWPLTYYAISKHMGEDLGKMYARKHGLS